MDADIAAAPFPLHYTNITSGFIPFRRSSASNRRVDLYIATWKPFQRHPIMTSSSFGVYPSTDFPSTHADLQMLIAAFNEKKI
jgi:hypothetical protein